MPKECICEPLTSQTKTVTSRTTRVIIVEEISDTSAIAATISDISAITATSKERSPFLDAESLAPTQSSTASYAIQHPKLRKKSSLLENFGALLPLSADSYDVVAPSIRTDRVDQLLSAMAASDVQRFRDDESNVAAVAADHASKAKDDGLGGSSCAIESGQYLETQLEQQQTTRTTTRTTHTSRIEYVKTASCDGEIRSDLLGSYSSPSTTVCGVSHVDRSVINEESNDEVNETRLSGRGSVDANGDQVRSSKKSKFPQIKMTSAAAGSETRHIQTVSKSVEMDDQQISKAMKLYGCADHPIGLDWNLVACDEKSSTKEHSTEMKPFSRTRRASVGSYSLATGGDVSTMRALVNAATSNSSGGGFRTQKILKHGIDDLASIEDSLTYRMLKPIIVTMALCGMYYGRKSRVGTGICKNFGGCFLTRRLRLTSPMQIYCIIVISILTLNLTIALIGLGSNMKTSLFFKFTVAICCFESFFRALTFYVGCRDNKNGLRELFTTIDTVFFSDGIIPYERLWSRCIRFALVISIVSVTAEMAVLIYGVNMADNLCLYLMDAFRSEEAKAKTPSSSPILFNTYMTLMIVLNGVVGSMSLAFYTSMCYLFYKEFEYIRRTFARKVADLNESSTTRGALGQFGAVSEIERFRICHQRRCQVLHMADHVLKRQIAVTCVSCVLSISLLMADICFGNLDSFFDKLMSIFRMSYDIFYLLVVLIAAVRINLQAHAPLVDIHSIRVQNNGARQLEISMFLSKLTSAPIGLTAWDMFEIENSTFMRLFWIMVSFFIILLQLHMADEDNSCCMCNISNCTNLSNATLT